MWRTGGAFLFIAYWALALIQVAAFTRGVHISWGWPYLGAFLFWLVCAALLGPVGAIATLIFTFIGAKDGWGWEWWQAVLIAAPFLVLQLGLLVINGGAGLWGSRRRRWA